VTREHAANVSSSTCARWLSGHGPLAFLAKVRELDAHRLANGSASSSEEAQLIHAAAEVSKGGLSRATSRLESLGVAPATPETLDAVRALHPSPSEEEKAACVQGVQELKAALGSRVGDISKWSPFEADVVARTINEMSLDSAADLSGLRVGHLRLLARCGYTATVHALLVGALRGTLPQKVSRYLWAGRVLPLIKNSSMAIRPITVPSLWARILGTIFSSKLAKVIPPTLEPLQVGVHTPSGTEVSALLAQTALLEDPTRVLVCFDIKNAFNSVNRSLIFRVAKESGNPFLQAYVLRAYGAGPTECLFRSSSPSTNAIIDCATGVKQGDSLSSLLFAMAIHPVLMQVAAPLSNPPPSLTSAFLDDIMCTDTNERAKALVNGGLQKLLDEGKTGLVLSVAKTVAYCPSSDLTVEAGEWSCTVRAPLEGVVVLGIPVGSPSFISSHVKGKALATAPLLSKLSELPLQHAVLLLRYCIVSKMNHLYRSCPPSLCAEAAKVFDELVWETVRSLLDAPPESECASLGFDLQRARMALSLPLRMGGCGLTPSSLVLPAAFVAGTRASFFAAGALRPDWLPRIKAWISAAPPRNGPCAINSEIFRASLHEALAFIRQTYEMSIGRFQKKPTPPHLRETIYPFSLEELLAVPAQLQKNVTLLIQSVELDRFFETLQKPQRAALLSRASPHGLDFLRSVPSSPTLYIPSHAMRYGLRRLAFMPVSNSALLPSPDPARAMIPFSGDLDAIDRSLLRDKFSTSASPRHTSMLQQIIRMLRALGLNCTLEPEVPNSDAKRGDIRIFGRVIQILDFSGVSSTRVDTLDRASRTAGVVADVAAKAKVAKYGKLCSDAGFEFIPLIMEEDGFIHEDFLKLVASACARAPDFPFAVPEFTTWAAPTPQAYWLQAISVSFLKGSAEMWQSGMSKRSAKHWRHEDAPHPAVSDQLFLPSVGTAL
jgi:hypothetical protein